MKPTPTGHLERTAEGVDLVLTRSFHAAIEDVWTSVTASDSTARWFGRWEGEPGVGNKVRLQMLFEDGAPWMDVTIVACDEPRRLAVRTEDAHGVWRLELTLTSQGETTTLEFVQHLEDTAMVGEVGPGWEYYLDRLVAAHSGSAPPEFSEYYPAQKAHYQNAATEL